MDMNDTNAIVKENVDTGVTEDEDVLDETPEFVDMNDAVEVDVGDDDVPMEDDDDDDEAVELDAQQQEERPPPPDMSRVKFTSHTGPVYAVASYMDPATKSLTLVSGAGDDKAFLHKVVASTTNSDSLHLSHAHTDSVSCVALNLDLVDDKSPRLAAVGGYDGAIVLYNPDTGDKLQTLEGPSDVEWLAFHPKGGTVLLAGSAEDGTIWMYHIPLQKCLQVFVGHEKGVTAGSFSPDGKWALSAGLDGTLRIWAPRTGRSKHVFRLGDDGAGLTCLAVQQSADGQLVLVGGEDGLAHVCHIGNKKVVATLRHFEPPMGNQASTAAPADNEEEDEDVEMLPMSVEAVGFSPSNPNWCATGGVDGVLKIWDLAIDGQCRQICRVPESEAETAAANTKGGITRLAWHPTLPLIFTSSCSGSLQLWDARNGNLLHVLTGHSDVINDMDIRFENTANNGGTAVIVTGSDDNTVRVYEVDIGAVIAAAQEVKVASS